MEKLSDVETQMQDAERAAIIYALLAAGWRLPSGALCRDIVSGRFGAVLGDLLAAAGIEAALVAEVRAVGQELGGADEVQLALEPEYIQLLVASPRVPCPPYESAWRERRGEQNFGPVYGEASDEVLSAYQAAGFDPAAEIHDAPDHIAMEFEFVGRLRAAERQALEVGDTIVAAAKRQGCQTFLQEHIGMWSEEFLRAVQKETTEAFYRTLAAISLAVLAVDRM